MKRCLVLARSAWAATAPNPLVGCIVLDAQGKKVGQGYHHKAGLPHAEVLALREAGKKARGGSLYVSLEPCFHQGRTPACAPQVLASGVSRVIIATQDPNPKVAGQSIAWLREQGIEVVAGIEEEKAQQLNEVFFHRLQSTKPFVHSKIALSNDGYMGHRSKRLVLTGSSAQRHTMKLRARYQAILTGIGTVLTDNPQMTVRGINISYQPIRMLVDSHLRCPEDALILNPKLGKSMLFCLSSYATSKKASKIRDLGVQIIGLNKALKGGLDLPQLMKALHEINIDSLLLEAGPRLTQAFWDTDLVNRQSVYLSPIELSQHHDKKDLLEGPSPPFQAEIQSAIRMGRDLRVQIHPGSFTR